MTGDNQQIPRLSKCRTPGHRFLSLFPHSRSKSRKPHIWLKHIYCLFAVPSRFLCMQQTTVVCSPQRIYYNYFNIHVCLSICLSVWHVHVTLYDFKLASFNKNWATKLLVMGNCDRNYNILHYSLIPHLQQYQIIE